MPTETPAAFAAPTAPVVAINSISAPGALESRTRGFPCSATRWPHSPPVPALVEHGALFEMVPYPGSRHAALSFRDTGAHGWKAILDFFDRYLQMGTGTN